jgi:hypothetical protein
MVSRLTSNTDARLSSTDVTMVRTENNRPASEPRPQDQEAASRLVHDDDLKACQGHSFSARAEDGSGTAMPAACQSPAHASPAKARR